MRILDCKQPDFDACLDARLSSRNDPAPNSDVETRVRDIVHAVRTRGDEALLELTETLDRWKPSTAANLVVQPSEIDNALRLLNPIVLDDLRIAAQRIEQFHRRQRERNRV